MMCDSESGDIIKLGFSNNGGLVPYGPTMHEKSNRMGYLIGGLLIFSLIAKSNFLYFSQVLVRRFLQNYVAPIFDLCVNIVLH